MSFISHDLRNLVHRLFGYVYILTRQSNVKDQPEFAPIITGLNATNHEISELINNTLQTRMFEEGRIAIFYTPLDLNETLEQLVSSINHRAEQKKIKLHFAPEPQFAHFITDQMAVERIADNLISNAVKFSPANTTVSVSLHGDEKQVEIWVEDEGPGFQPQDLEKVFSRFTRLTAKPTLQESSTGLGLSIVKAFTEKLNGKIEFGNRPTGKGAFFKVTLPAGTEKAKD